MSTRKIGMRHMFEWVLLQVGKLAVSNRDRGVFPSLHLHIYRSEKATHSEIAKLLKQKRDTITLWLQPTTSSISTKNAKAVQERLIALGQPDLAEIFESSLTNVDGYFASLVYDGIQRQTIADLESKFIPLLNAIANDGMTPPGEQTRRKRQKVVPPGQVFRQKLWEVVNSHRRATNKPLLRLGEAALRPALREPDICLALLRALAFLGPHEHEPLGIWRSLTPDKKRTWIQGVFRTIEVTVDGWEQHRHDERGRSPEIDNLVERLAKDVPTDTPLVQPPADAKVWESDTPCKNCGSHLTFFDGYGFSCKECDLWKDGNESRRLRSDQNSGRR